jgi:hypothetical protein
MSEIDNYRLPDKAPEPPEDDLTLDEGLSPLRYGPIAGDPELPANVDAEKTILGAILLDNAAFREAAECLESDDFSLDSHRRIFLRMAELVDTDHAVDIVTLVAKLSQYKEVAAVGGVAYLADLTMGLPRRPVIEEYIRIVKDKSLLRKVMGICSTAIARAADQSETALEVLGAAELALADLLPKYIRYRPEEILVSATDFAADAPRGVDWAVWGVMQRGGNGVIAADGKTGKSLLAIHLALHLATGTDWLGLPVTRPVQVALISREDDPGETARRIGSMVAGSAAELRYLATLDERFWLSTRAQMPTFLLENKKEVREITEALKHRKVEIAFFDVFRSLWTGDENDAQEESKVLEVLRGIQREAGCSVVLLHHLNKGDSVNPFQKLRGSTALSGWWEWGMGISIVNQEEDETAWVREIRFQTKAARAHSRIHYRIAGPEEAMRMERTEAPERAEARPRRKVAEIVSGGRDQGAVVREMPPPVKNYYEKEEA